MKKLLFSICLLMAATFLCGCHAQKEETPYNRAYLPDTYERNFRKYIFASCSDSEKFYATYSLAHLDAKPTECEPTYKVTFVNGPCNGQTIRTNDVILKTSPIGSGQLVKGDIVLRDYWNPRVLNKNTHTLDRWNRGVVYDTSRREQGVIELEFPRDKNDFMAPREFVYLQNVRYIEKPQSKEMRTWL